MAEREAWDIVSLARNANRLTARDYIDNVFTGFFELHGDRSYGDDKAILAGLAYLEDRKVMVIGHNRGKGHEEMEACNYGMPEPEGYRKCLRLTKLAEKFGIPVIYLVDTPGAYMGVESEHRGQASAIANMLVENMSARVPIISVVIGQGGSGGALAMAVADAVLMLENTTYSILSPEGFSTILFKDAKRAAEAAKVMKMTPKDLLDLKVIQGIIEEAPEGNWTDPQRTYDDMRTMIGWALDRLEAKTVDELVQKRHDRYRAY